MRFLLKTCCLLGPWKELSSVLILIMSDCNRKARQILFHLYCINSAMACIFFHTSDHKHKVPLAYLYFFVSSARSHLHAPDFYPLYQHLSAVCSPSLSCSDSPLCCINALFCQLWGIVGKVHTECVCSDFKFTLPQDWRRRDGDIEPIQ